MAPASTLRLETERLLLVPFTLELLEALHQPRDAERALGATIPDGWPDEELRGLLALYAGWLRGDPTVLGYGPWVVIARGEETVVASAGFVGKPDSDGAVELGYGTHPDYRNRGHASEAAGALVRWALDQPGVERVMAKCDPDNLPSVRVLENIGMRRTGRADGQLVWEAVAGRRSAY
jgi:RimJ/RimL family protein N-acetyltransferase